MKFVENAETAVLAAAKDMLRRGLVEGTAGNISARREDGNLVITPSSVDYAEMTLDDLVVVDPDGGVLQAAEGRSPSSEMKLHLACFQAYDDIGSVIHSHPVWATMFAIAHQPIPACIDEFAIYCGGEIRCADYAASGTPEVGSNAVKALEGRAAALIANHGLVAVGPRPDKVLHVTALVERTAQIVWGARALGGPVPIPDDVNAGFAGIYGYLLARLAQAVSNNRKPSTRSNCLWLRVANGKSKFKQMPACKQSAMPMSWPAARSVAATPPARNALAGSSGKVRERTRRRMSSRRAKKSVPTRNSNAVIAVTRRR